MFWAAVFLVDALALFGLLALFRFTSEKSKILFFFCDCFVNFAINKKHYNFKK